MKNEFAFLESFIKEIKCYEDQLEINFDNYSAIIEKEVGRLLGLLKDPLHFGINNPARREFVLYHYQKVDLLQKKTIGLINPYKDFIAGTLLELKSYLGIHFHEILLDDIHSEESAFTLNFNPKQMIELLKLIRYSVVFRNHSIPLMLEALEKDRMINIKLKPQFTEEDFKIILPLLRKRTPPVKQGVIMRFLSQLWGSRH